MNQHYHKTLIALLIGLTLPGVGNAQLFDDSMHLAGAPAPRFARILGKAIFVQAPAPAAAVAGEFIIDHKSGESNELIILLAGDQLLPPTKSGVLAASGKSPLSAEMALINSVANKTITANSALGQPLHARFMFNPENDTRNIEHKSLTGDTPQAKLARFLIVRYPTVELARIAERQLKAQKSVASVGNNRRARTSWTPNDPYFSDPLVVGPTDPALIAPMHQWGMKAMKFPLAWDSSRGHAWIGLLEPEFPGSGQAGAVIAHSDLQANYRRHLSESVERIAPGVYSNHAMHVAGILAAESNNRNWSIDTPNGNGAAGSASNGGVAGGCPSCSITPYVAFNNGRLPNPGDFTAANLAAMIMQAVNSGMQVINWSGGIPGIVDGCASGGSVICTALDYASQRGVLVVEASGNDSATAPHFPATMADRYNLLPVGGTDSLGKFWQTGRPPGNESGSNYASLGGVLAPAKDIVSIFNRYSNYNPNVFCSDIAGADLSANRYPHNGSGDGVGTCTGTSMAAPHISALAALIWSVNPRLPASEVRNIIRRSGNNASTPNATIGYGLPNASTAMTAALGSNPSKLTPLFSFYSTQRSDAFYTTVPQMATAALRGTLMPRGPGSTPYATAFGTAINGYAGFPDPALSNVAALAEVWVFTTHENPKDSTQPLEPLYRLSWKCGDATAYPPALCASNPAHVDTLLVNQSEVSWFVSTLGYKVDGIEGYVYPKSLPQPPGTVHLLRMYNPARDDHAHYPLSAYQKMLSQGYNAYTNGTNWLGYVYPNTNGTVPVIQ